MPTFSGFPLHVEDHHSLVILVLIFLKHSSPSSQSSIIFIESQLFDRIFQYGSSILYLPRTH